MLNFGRVKFWGVAAQANQAPQDGLPEVVLAGRSNAGKSSLVNALANQNRLAKVSQTPGKTQLVVYFNVDEALYLTDLPGYGYARTSQDKKARFQKLADAYFQSGRKIASVLLLIDIRHEPSVQDRQMHDYLIETGQPYALIFAKADKLSRSAAFQQRAKLLKILKPAESVPVFVLSSSKKQGLDELKAYLSTLA